MAKVVLIILQKFRITLCKVSYFVLNNASNDNSTIQVIAQKPKWGFNPVHRRLQCGSYTLNLVSQVLLQGKKAEALNNNHALSNIAEETQLIKEWRYNSLSTVLLTVITFIKAPHQYALFKDFQRLAQSELPKEKQTILEPVKLVVTR
jgi:hypothetical protein